MLPQTPIPVQAAQLTLTRNDVKSSSATPNATYQAFGGRGAPATRQTLSVILANGLSPLGGSTKGLSPFWVPTNGLTSLTAAIRQAPDSGCERVPGTARAGGC